MKWRGSEDASIVRLVLWALFLLWLVLLIKTPPSIELLRDVQCNLVPTEEFPQGYPMNCQVVWRVYPDPHAWLYEFTVEPLMGIRQDW